MHCPRLRALVISLPLLSSCASHHPQGTFRVLPSTPEYALRFPDSKEASFAEVLRLFNGFVAGQGWLDLRPQMELRIENAYYKEGLPKHGLAGFLGTEIAQYQVRPNGSLRHISVQSGLARRPADQPPVQDLIRPAQMHYRHSRFFFAIVFKRQGDARGSVLLGARSAGELNRLAAGLLADPDSICGGASPNCTVFPQACSVSPEIEIVVNGSPRTVPWGSVLATVAARPRHVELWRSFAGRMTPVEMDSRDANALRLPLLPGDRIQWE